MSIEIDQTTQELIAMVDKDFRQESSETFDGLIKLMQTKSGAEDQDIIDLSPITANISSLKIRVGIGTNTPYQIDLSRNTDGFEEIIVFPLLAGGSRYALAKIKGTNYIHELPKMGNPKPLPPIRFAQILASAIKVMNTYNWQIVN